MYYYFEEVKVNGQLLSGTLHIDETGFSEGFAELSSYGGRYVPEPETPPTYTAVRWHYAEVLDEEGEEVKLTTTLCDKLDNALDWVDIEERLYEYNRN